MAAVAADGSGLSGRAVVLGKGFNVSQAPTTVGRVSYRVVVSEETNPTAAGAAAKHTATYRVDPSSAGAKAAGVLWGVRWPGAIVGSITCSGCTVRAHDDALGLAKVQGSSGAAPFSVTAQWAASSSGP